MWKERFFYFVLKWEFNYIDNLDKASALSTDQIDIENAQRYGIVYVDETGKKQTPMILHNSPSGAIERIIFGLLENAGKMQATGKIAILPVWLSPVQVRLLPVSQKFVDACKLMSEDLESSHIRVDIDDREESVGKRIRDAEKEWVPYIVVIGDKEAQDPTQLKIRVRGSGEKVMSPDELKREISSETTGRPQAPLPVPKLLSRRASFEMSS
jgi:threonyl-tRNA synthetase